MRRAELNADMFSSVEEGDEVTLSLPWPPSVNDFKVPHPKVRGLYFLTKRAKQFREDVQWLCCRSRRFGSLLLQLDIVLNPPDKRLRDADNFIKATFDALMAARVFDDDSQIQDYRVRKGATVPGGAVVVKIRELKDTIC